MIAITGARGFIGRAVHETLRSRGNRIVTIGRSADADVRWPDAAADFGSTALARLAGAHAVVHLAGENIGVRWTEARKREILESRSRGTATLARGLTRLNPRPSVLLSASAVGFYGAHGDEWLDEESASGTDFLSAVTRAWEDATTPARDAGIRVVRMRFGVAIGPGGGMLARVRLPFSLGLGGRLGSGQQWMSWVALDDIARFVLRAIDDAVFDGPVNVTSPSPVRNREFTEALAVQLGRPAVLPAPAFALRAVFGEMADAMLLSGQRVRPARLLAAGFEFDQPTIDVALRAALGR